MAYQNVPVADGYQVVQQLANFATANGWTVHRNDNVTDSGSKNYREVTVSVTGFPGYVTLAGYENSIYLNGHRGYDSSEPWFNQPDQYLLYDGDGDTGDHSERITRAKVELRVNPIQSVHFFGGLTPTPCLYAAIEMEPGYYRHMVIGHLQKFGTAKGGLFWDVSSAANDRKDYVSYYEYHRVPFLYNSQSYTSNYDAKGGFDCQDTVGANRFAAFDNYSESHLAGGHWSKEVRSLYVGSPIAFNSRTPLVTPLVWVSNNGYRPFGTPPNFRYVNLTYFEAGDEMTIGGDVWKVFPWARRKKGVRRTSDTVDGVYINYNRPEDEATEMYGIAYLKD